MLYGAFTDSAIVDERPHVPAGYSYIRYFDYRLNPEHPPLLKMIAAIPLLFIRPNFPLASTHWTNDINGQWDIGTEFLYQSGNNADQIIVWTRLMPILLTLFVIIFLYMWSKELLGTWWALLPTTLFAFSPTVLAHGHYVTTDLAATCGVVIALYFFIHFLQHPSARNIVYAGIAFGIAQLLKFSLIILIPIFLLLAIIYTLFIAHNYLSYALKTGALFFVGFIFIYPVYFITTFHYPIEKQYSDTKTTLESFGGGPHKSGSTCDPRISMPLSQRLHCPAEITIHFTQNPVLRPYSQYLLGFLMVVQRGSGYNTIYFLGNVTKTGSWPYFPIVFLLKEQLISLLLITTALGAVLLRTITSNIRRNHIKIREYFLTHFTEFSMIIFIIIYWTISMKSPLNIGVRHILPTLPFIYILTTHSVKKLVRGSAIYIIIALVLLYVLNTFLATPYFLSFFNTIGKGNDGYRYVTDSNFDWGQDLKRLKEFKEKNNINRIAVDYFGGGDIYYYLGKGAEQWQSSKGNPKDYGIEWLAVSANTLQLSRGKLMYDEKRSANDEYLWLKDAYNPFTKAGTSIFIYKL